MEWQISLLYYTSIKLNKSRLAINNNIVSTYTLVPRPLLRFQHFSAYNMWPVGEEATIIYYIIIMANLYSHIKLMILVDHIVLLKS